MSFKLKLAIAFLAISITPVLFIATFSFYNAKNALQHARIAELESIADLKVDKLETFFSELKKDMQMFRDSFNGSFRLWSGNPQDVVVDVVAELKANTEASCL